MAQVNLARPVRRLECALIFLFFFAAGLALSRLLYEGLFPRALWLARPLAALLLALLSGLAGFLGWRILRRSALPPNIAWAFSPLLLTLLYLPDPAVNLIASRFVFAAALWLAAVFLARALAPAKAWPWLGLLALLLALLPVYLLTMPSVVGQADTFEFQVVVPTLGIAHPTGYPLYILLGRLFAALPIGSMAWRVNLASAVFAIAAACLLYLSGRRLTKRELPPLLAAVLFGLTPTMWSQAVIAEVYALHALLVASVMWLLIYMVERAPLPQEACMDPLATRPLTLRWVHIIMFLAFLLGLGLTNHLTTLFLLPPAALAVFLSYGRCLRAQSWRANLRLLLGMALAFSLPLLLYSYLPLRWQVLNNEPMGLARFVAWVIGGRFQGALQLTGWLIDPARYGILGRLLLTNWGWFNLGLAAAGLAYLAWRNWRAALVLLLTWLGFVFYALNYYVPDLAVFVIPAHFVIAIFWGAGLATALEGAAVLLQRLQRLSWSVPLQALLLLLLLLPALTRIVAAWPDTRYKAEEALQHWGAGVLALPLPQDAAILADSEKIAPLYYLQQVEGVRPDLEISVLPDEGAYRAELDARLAAGQPVFLARFLPGLEGVYYLRSFGPLLEVSTTPLTEVPPGAVPANLDFDGLRLLAYDLEEPSAVNSQATAVTLYWQALQPDTSPRLVYMRWLDPQTAEVLEQTPGQHPAGNYYPTVAWRGDEIVPDFHLLPHPFSSSTQELTLQVALGPPFAAADELAWQPVATLEVGPAEPPSLSPLLRAQNGSMLLSGVRFPPESRPATPLPLLLSGYGSEEGTLSLSLVPEDQAAMQPPGAGPVAPQDLLPLYYTTAVNTDLPPGDYQLRAAAPSAAAICGWLAPVTSACDLGQVTISGAPLPDGATNFADKLALLSIDLPSTTLQPGGTLPVTLNWQGLAQIDEDYTVFLQVLDGQDRLVGQVDAWPVQGTFPTSAWQPSEQVRDPYEIQLAADMPPGEYRLQVGLYLLATLQRLPVLDESGAPIDDKVVVGGLVVAE